MNCKCDASEMFMDASEMFMRAAQRSQIALRKANAEFLARGLASRDKVRQTRRDVQSEGVLEKLNARLQARKV